MVTPRDAATVMLVRDAPDLQVFMAVRNAESTWIAGASVFPGGAIDQEDREASWAARCDGWDDARASAALGVSHGGLGFWVGAIRETYEEAGVLMARHSDGTPVDASDPEFVGARGALNAGTLDFMTFVATHDLMLATAELHPFAHWITPAGSVRRYDTRFFICAAPPGAYEHDNAELVSSTWTRPLDALNAADRGELDLILPTRRSLEILAAFDRAADVIEATQAGVS